MKYLIALLLSCSTLMAVPPIGYNDPTIGGLVGWWTMNEGSGTLTTADLSGNGNTGYFTNSPAWTNGVVGSGLSFNGRVDAGANVVSVLDSLSLQQIRTNITISVWIYSLVTSNRAEYDVVVKTMGTTAVYGPGIFGLGFVNGMHPYCQAGDGATRILLQPNTIFPTNKWVFFSYTYDGSTITMYSNAVNIASGSFSVVMPTNKFSIDIGGVANLGLINQQTFYGHLDDVRIYNRALSSNEMLKLYNGGYGSQK